jgi:CheY-like chemotaxis protein
LPPGALPKAFIIPAEGSPLRVSGILSPEYHPTRFAESVGYVHNLYAFLNHRRFDIARIVFIEQPMSRILLVEPDPAIREFIAGILAEFGHDVMMCENLLEASIWVVTSPFDALVTDLVLHSEQGSTLSRNCAARGIRTITLTGREYRADQSEATRPASLLEKPFRFSDLQRVLEAVEAPRSSASIGRATSSAA